MESVDILLATYNGAGYLKQQLLSICAQTCDAWHVLIHDDGSDDRTMDVAMEMAAKYPNIQIIDDKVRCGSAAENFLYLLQFSTAPYIMFCDQDDVWFDNKVEVMRDAISKRDNTSPQVVYSNSYVWYPASGIIGQGTFCFPSKLEDFLFMNFGMQGCVAIFNSPMRTILSDWQGPCAMHDHLLHLAGLTLGSVEYLHVPLMLYRQHQSNLTGETYTKLSYIRSLKNTEWPVVDKKHYMTVMQFSNRYAKELSEHNRRLISRYLMMPEKNIVGKINTVIRNKFTLYNSTIKLIIKILVRKKYIQ